MRATTDLPIFSKKGTFFLKNEQLAKKTQVKLQLRREGGGSDLFRGSKNKLGLFESRDLYETAAFYRLSLANSVLKISSVQNGVVSRILGFSNINLL